jgi:hypothetical protein
VTDLAGALGLVDLLAGLDELGGRDVAAFERQFLRGLGLDLGDEFAYPEYAPITMIATSATLIPTGMRI